MVSRRKLTDSSTKRESDASGTALTSHLPRHISSVAEQIPARSPQEHLLALVTIVGLLAAFVFAAQHLHDHIPDIWVKDLAFGMVCLAVLAVLTVCMFILVDGVIKWLYTRSMSRSSE